MKRLTLLIALAGCVTTTPAVDELAPGQRQIVVLYPGASDGALGEVFAVFGDQGLPIDEASAVLVRGAPATLGEGGSEATVTYRVTLVPSESRTIVTLSGTWIEGRHAAGSTARPVNSVCDTPECAPLWEMMQKMAAAIESPKIRIFKGGQRTIQRF